MLQRETSISNKATALHEHVHDHVDVHVDVHVLVDVVGFFRTTPGLGLPAPGLWTFGCLLIELPRTVHLMLQRETRILEQGAVHEHVVGFFLTARGLGRGQE
jgi:hypothetical protein